MSVRWLGEQQAHSWESAVSGIIPLPVDCVSSLGQEHRLVFLKSIMVGVVTMVSAAICSGIAVIIVLAFKSPQFAGRADHQLGPGFVATKFVHGMANLAHQLRVWVLVGVSQGKAITDGFCDCSLRKFRQYPHGCFGISMLRVEVLITSMKGANASANAVWDQGR